jgi:hypothetical protein
MRNEECRERYPKHIRRKKQIKKAADFLKPKPP